MAMEAIDEEQLDPENDQIIEEEIFEGWWSSKQKRPGVRPVKAKRLTSAAEREKHKGFFGTELARQQHTANLLTAARVFSAMRRDKEALDAISALLQAENPRRLDKHWQNLFPAAKARMAEVLVLAYQIVARYPTQSSVDELRHHLHLAKNYQLTPIGQNLVTFMQGQLLLDRGSLSAAYDKLEEANGLVAETRFQRHSMIATTRTMQWREAIIHGQARSNTAAPAQQFNPYRVGVESWSRAGRDATDLHKGAVKNLEDCVSLDRAASDAVMKLAQLQLAVGQGQLASQELVEYLAANDKHIAIGSDVLNLSTLLALEGVKRAAAQPNEAIMQLCDIIALQPRNTFAVALLAGAVELEESNMFDPIVLQALASYIDITEPVLKRPGLDLTVFRLLLGGIATTSVQVSEQQQLVGAASHQLDLAVSTGNISETPLQPVCDALKAAMHVAKPALERWTALVALLQQREWWVDTHLLLPEQASDCSKLLKSGVASQDTLGVLIAVKLSMNCILNQQQTETFDSLNSLSSVLTAQQGQDLQAVLQIIATAVHQSKTLSTHYLSMLGAGEAFERRYASQHQAAYKRGRSH